MEKECEELLISGLGGQGVLLMGQLLVYAGILENKEVCLIRAYGTEMRGGRVSCMLSISTETVVSPILETFDTLLAFDEMSLREFEPKVKKDGLIIWNSSLVKEGPERKDVHMVEVKLDEIANGLGNSKVVNMIMLGAYASRKKIVSKESIIKAMEEFLPPKLMKFIQLNKQAFEKGGDVVST